MLAGIGKQIALRTPWVRLAIVLLGATLALNSAAAGVTTTFIGGAPAPNQTDFNTAANWSNGIPGPSDTAIIDVASYTRTNPTFVFEPTISVNNSVGSLQMHAASVLHFAVTTATLTCGSATLNTCTIFNAGLGGGNLQLNGAVTLTGLCKLSCVTTIAGTLTTDTGGYNIVFPGNLTFPGATTITGTVIIDGQTTLTLNGATTLNGTLIEQGQAVGVLAGTGSLTVNGAVNVTGGFNCNIPSFTTTAATTTNMTPGLGAGTITPANGTTCTFNGPITMNKGSFSLNATSIVNLNNSVAFKDSTISGDSAGTVNLAAGATLTSDNTTAAKNTVAPVLNIAGTLTINSGGFQVVSGTLTGTLNATPGGPFTLNGSTFVLSGNAAVAGAFEIVFGSFTINKALTYTGSMTLNGQGGNLAGTGSLTVNGPFNVNSGGSGSSSSLPLITLPAGQTMTFPANGRLSLTTPNANVVCNGTMTMAQNSRIDIGNGCTFTCSGNVSIDQISGIASSGNFVLTSTATLTSTHATAANQISCNTTNAGTVVSQTGVLDFGTFGGTYNQSAGSISMAGGNLKGDFNLTGGKLIGSGSINGTVNVSGTASVSPGTPAAAGTIAISSTYTQAATGTLNIKLGGTAAGTFDQVTVGGKATLAGTLNVTTIGGFAPQAANTFQIMPFGSIGGTFGTVSAGTTGLAPVYGASAVTLAAASGNPNPVPGLVSIAPSTVTAGGPAIELTATGTNFIASSTVQINGSPRATTFVSATKLTAIILAGDVATAGAPSITVVTPAPGGGASSALPLTVTAGSGGAGTAPAITSALTAVGLKNVAFSYVTVATGSAPITFGATTLPTGVTVDTKTGIISGTPTVSGTFNVGLSATNAAGTDAKILQLLILDSIASGSGGGGGGGGNTNPPQLPFLPSEPFAMPNPATVGQAVTLAAVAGTLSGNTLQYAWNFGDGTTGVGATVTHTYAGAGVYTATVTVADSNLSISRGVLVAVNSGNSGTLTVLKAAFKVAPSGNKDSFQIAGTLTGGPDSAKTATLQFGTYKNSFAASDKSAKFGLSKGKFAAQVKNAALFDALKSIGAPSGAVPKPGTILTIPLVLTVGSANYAVDFDVLYTATDTSGSAKK